MIASVAVASLIISRRLDNSVSDARAVNAMSLDVSV